MRGSRGVLQGGIPVWRAVGGLGAGAVDSVDDSAYTPLISNAGVALLCRHHIYCGHDPVYC